MDGIEVIRAAIPDADEALCEHIVWGRTPYPVGKVTARSLYRAASGYRRANEAGKRLCDWCERTVSDGKWVCERCRDALDTVRRDDD